jgi:hypothetical protein
MCGCGEGHATYGACLRAKNIRVGYCRSAVGLDKTRQDRWDAELAAYKAARSEGIQPDGTTMDKINRAKEISDRTGVAYGA